MQVSSHQIYHTTPIAHPALCLVGSVPLLLNLRPCRPWIPPKVGCVESFLARMVYEADTPGRRVRPVGLYMLRILCLAPSTR